MIHIYYGCGKGKTTAALGLGMRARGTGMRVSLVRFLKDSRSSELSVLPFEIYPSPENLPFHPGKMYQGWVDSALKYIVDCKSDIIILDEFLDIIGEYITEEKAQELIVGLNKKEIIITGHRVCEQLFSIADYITHMDKIKHPYDSGVKARKGIEY